MRNQNIVKREIDLPRNLASKLDDISYKTEIPDSAIIRDALKFYLNAYYEGDSVPGVLGF
jgi:metal-responsive CopG/Arc/MetJ family transcriptional regulator